MRAAPLIIAPSHTRETRILAPAAVNLYRFFLSNGVRAHLIAGTGARRLPLLVKLRALREQRIAVFYYGHGTKKTLIGDELGIRKTPNFHLVTENLGNRINRRIIEGLQGSLVYTIACDSADDLGEFLVANGVRAFVGSTVPMFITHDFDWDRNNVPDITDAMTVGPRRLYGGATLEQAVEDYRSRAFTMMNEYDFKVRNKELSLMMDQNVRNYKIIGDGGWQFWQG